MNDNTVFVKNYNEKNNGVIFPINEREIWRYAGYMGNSLPTSGLEGLLEEVIEEVKKVITYKVCYIRVPISWEDDKPVLPFETDSKDLAKCLKGSSEIIMFAATVGLGIDRLIHKYQRLSPTKALLLQAHGAERVEALCDGFCAEIEKQLLEEGLCTTPRYSPGYGDMPLSTQVDVCNILDCSRQIGISLNDSLLMTPSKSVTAIFGIGGELLKKPTDKCSMCKNADCEYRKR